LRRNVTRQREQSFDCRLIALRRVLRPTPLVRPLVLLLRRLVVACRIASFAGVFATVVPAPMPSSNWCPRHCCASIFANHRRRPPQLQSSMPPSNAAVNRGHHPPPPQSNYISLYPPRPPPPPLRRRRPPLPPAATAAGPPPPQPSTSPPLSNSLPSIAEERGNSSTTTSIPTAAPTREHLQVLTTWTYLTYPQYVVAKFSISER